MKPLHEMNPQGRFSDRAADYANYRPSYPAAAIDSILAWLNEPSELVVADVGAGTGISSRLLAERGVRVLAIEPNREMRQAALPHPLVEFRDGSAEQTNLSKTSVDLVVCCQSFHWFNPEPTLLEFHRILKPTGRLAVVWNERDHDDDFTQNYSRLVQEASNRHPAESRMVAINPLLSSQLFLHVRCLTFAYQHGLNQDGLIGRAMSSSYIPRQGLVQQQLVSDLGELYNRFCDENGLVYLVYCTRVYLAEPSA
ncbi:MAG: class I SAM-dependent methyltransferase [Chroococcidiopsidaceae cyanobacterium CP_BM_ER_R8_30]|nr:class I SAM-dependent methyltransferase [Chroococcidiopsidaceae cyanobacterium CP_BM_ER_R8_30]